SGPARTAPLHSEATSTIPTAARRARAIPPLSRPDCRIWLLVVKGAPAARQAAGAARCGRYLRPSSSLAPRAAWEDGAPLSASSGKTGGVAGGLPFHPDSTSLRPPLHASRAPNGV